MHRPDNVDNPSRLRGLVEAITAVADGARVVTAAPLDYVEFTERPITLAARRWLRSANSVAARMGPPRSRELGEDGLEPMGVSRPAQVR